MRWVILTIITFSALIFCVCVQASNEINAFAPGVSTAYAVLRNASGQVWYVSGQTFEAWGTGARTADDYDISLTDKSGDMFVGDFDTNVSSGDYWIATHYQSGASPDDDDPVVWIENGYWSGSAWTPDTITPSDIADSVWDEAGSGHTSSGTFGEIVQDANDNVTSILEDTGTTLPSLINDVNNYISDLTILLETTVKDANDANNFTLTAGPDVNDAYYYHTIRVEDANDSHSELRYIADWEYDGSDPNITVDFPFSFTPAAGDKVWVLGNTYGGLLQWIYNKIAVIQIYDNRDREATIIKGY